MINFLPDLDTIESHKYKIIIVSLAYFGCFCFVMMLSLAMHNVVQFLIRQHRWRVLPLLFFYIMAMIVLVTRIYTLIYIVRDQYSPRIFTFYFPYICKLIVGYTQVWTITELTVRVNQCVMALNSTNNLTADRTNNTQCDVEKRLLSSSQERSSRQSNTITNTNTNFNVSSLDKAKQLQRYNTCIERKIIAFRYFSTLLILAAIVISCWQFIELDERLDTDLSKRVKQINWMRPWFELSSIVIIFMMIASNVALIIYLKKKENIMAEKLGNIGVFYSEKIKLILIAMTFVLSFCIDFAYERYYGGQNVLDNPTRKILLGEIYFIQDPIPIFVLLIFHLKNFRFVTVKTACVSTSSVQNLSNDIQSAAVSRLYDESKS